jgi:hypothetical protein
MNRFVKDMLMAQSRRGGDGRNPYGSRGGYVTSRPRRDRDMEDYADYEGRDMRRGGMVDMARDYGDYNRDYADYDMRRGDYGSQDIRGRGGYDRADYADYGMDYGMRDYGEMEYGKMSHKDIENWKRHMKNQDGTMGEHFKKEQVHQAARQIGVNPEEYGNEHIFGLVMNMMYSDYCAVAKKFGLDRPDFYAELAKAFLNDKDFEGEPEEKVWLYYKCISEKSE